MAHDFTHNMTIAVDDYRKDQDRFFQRLDELADREVEPTKTAEQKEEDRLIAKLLQLVPSHNAKGVKQTPRSIRRLAKTWQDCLEYSTLIEALEELIKQMKE